MSLPHPSEPPLGGSEANRAAPGCADGTPDPQLLVAAAARILCPGGGHCGLTVLLPDRPPETVGATDDLPVRIDWLQHELEEGPLLDGHQAPVRCDDLAQEARWPAFGKLGAAVIGVRSLVSCQVPLTDGTRVALSAYSRHPGAFDRASGDALRDLAAGALAPAALACERLRSTDPTTHGDGLLPTALGIVMAHHRVLPGRAFELLDQTAREMARGLFEVAIEVVLAGRLPALRPSAG